MVEILDFTGIGLSAYLRNINTIGNYYIFHWYISRVSSPSSYHLRLCSEREKNILILKVLLFSLFNLLRLSCIFLKMKPHFCGSTIVLIELFFMFQFTASEVGPGSGQNKSRLTNFHDNNCLLSCHYRKLWAAVGFLGRKIKKNKKLSP